MPMSQDLCSRCYRYHDSRKTYDSKCYDLALHFLEDKFDPAPPVIVVEELAVEIQRVVEDFLESIGK